jgi:ribonuclease P protein component
MDFLFAPVEQAAAPPIPDLPRGAANGILAHNLRKDHEQKNFSAQQRETSSDPRFPEQNEDQGRAGGNQPAPGQGPASSGCLSQNRLLFGARRQDNPDRKVSCMKPLSLPKTSLLRKPWEYKNVYNGGQRLRGDRFTIIHAANGSEASRLGISVHGVKRAVKRNRIKRIVREFFRLNRSFITPAADIVFAVRNGFTPDSPTDIKHLVEQLLNGNKKRVAREHG